MRITVLFCLLCCFVSVSSAQQQRVQKTVTSRNNVAIDTLGNVRFQIYNQREYRTAETFFELEKESYGWTKPREELLLLTDEKRAHSRHVTYQQSFKGIPVVDKKVRVNFDRFGRISMVVSSFDQISIDPREFDANPSISGSKAAEIAFREVANNQGKVTEATLGVLSEEAPILVWEVIVWPASEPAEYRTFVDAKSGQIVKAFNQAVAFRHQDDQEDARVDGSGYVFDPSPLHVAGVNYGPPYVDADNADSPVLNAARKLVTLPGITLNTSGKYQLVGPHLTITGINQFGSEVYTPPTETSPNGFQYTRNQSGFEAVNAYYHIDKSQRYVQSLGIMDRLNSALRVNPQGLTSDDSYYFPYSPPIIVFGTGGVDDAEDLSVIWHEYAHALLDAVAPDLLGSGEGQAFHEGWADYWAASYQRSLVENSTSARSDWRKLFAWDSGDGTLWSGRSVNSSGMYPQDVCTTRGGSCNIYTDGLVWASTMMEVYDQLGRATTDRLSLLSHAYLSSPLRFSDAAQAVIQADLDYNQGANLAVLVDVFDRRGLVDGSQFAPIISHTPLSDTEDLGGTISVEADVVGISGSLVSVELFTESTSKGIDSFSMSHQEGNRFATSFVLPTSLDSVFYYFRVADSGGRITFLPENAPSERYKFIVGEDTHPPVIQHIPIGEAAFVQWPLKIEAKVTDNFAVASVHTEFVLSDNQGQEVFAGTETLRLSGGVYSATLNVPFEKLKKGQTLSYQIQAQDNSSRGNISRLPESGSYQAQVTASGLLRSVDFETGDPMVWTRTGQWEQGAPTFGLQFAHKADHAMGTKIGSAYASDGSQSVLQLETINLSDIGSAELSFWHFYDTESDQFVGPGETSGVIYDGGVVQYRAEGSTEWHILLPDGGYPGQFSSDSSNPLAGSAAFGGYSYGWRKEKFVLPPSDGLQIRLVFATNTTNTHFSRAYAGWLVDDIRISTLTAADVEAPSLTEIPESQTIASIDDPISTVEIRTADNDGIQSVVMYWTHQSGTSQIGGVDRLSQDEFEADRFELALEMTAAALSGDVFQYYLEIRDPSGNTTRLPAGTNQHKIVFRVRDVSSTTQEIWTTGNWRAQTQGWISIAEGKNQVSTLNLKPIQLPTNAVLAELELTHSYQFSSHMAGQVEISTDRGSSWNLLVPVSGYSGTVPAGGVPNMVGEKAFLGSSGGNVLSRFSLTNYVGNQVFIRIVAATASSSSDAQSWSIESMELKNETEANEFEIENTFALLPVFPNPFIDRTNVTFSLEEATDVDLRLYDMLGREVTLLFSGRKSAGAYSMTLERNALVSGVYVLKLQAGSRLKTQTVVVAR